MGIVYRNHAQNQFRVSKHIYIRILKKYSKVAKQLEILSYYMDTSALRELLFILTCTRAFGPR